jgi:hypothetical protein
MYNPQVIESRLEKVKPLLNFELTRHSYTEVSRAVDYINNLIEFDLYEQSVAEKSKTKIIFKDEASKKEFQSDKIQTFIKNETILSKFDCFYWMERYYKISDIRNIFIQYRHNDAQNVWARIHSRLEGLGRAIRTLDLKARQVGKTTFAQGVVEHRLQFYTDIKSMIASKDETSTGKMADMFVDSMNKQPFWLRPQLRNFERGSEYIYDNGSGLFLGWGTQRTLAKGTTVTVSHLSEIASFKYFVEAIENALMRAMHETIWLLQVFEGTAERRDDDFHKKVKETIQSMERGISSLYFSFIPYFVRSDIYPPPAYITGRSAAFADYIPSTETLMHAKKAENWVKSNIDMREVLGSNWQMSKETMFWYETEKNAAIARDELGVFLSQVPADWEEAFQHAGKTIYPIELINSYENKAQGIIPEVYKLRGDSNEISPDLFPSSDEILNGGRKIPIRTNWTSAAPASDFELVQIKFEGWDRFDPINKFLIWQHPNSKFEYGSGVDTSDGLGRNASDNAVIEIVRKGTPEHKDTQVCEFASPDLTQKIMWPFVLAICTYYSPNRNQQLLAIECNKGYELQNAMITHGWWNLHKVIDEGKLGQDLSKIHKYGFETNGATRGALIDNFSTFFKGNWINLYSVPLIGEVKDLQKIRTISSVSRLQRDRIEGGLSGDDRFMATGIILYSMHRMERLGFEKASWEERERNENSKFEPKTFDGYEFEQLGNTDVDSASFSVTIEDNQSYLDNLDRNLGNVDW